MCALVFAIAQCACSLTALVPLELGLQALLSVFIVPLSVTVVAKVFGVGADSSADPPPIDDALSRLSLATNVLGMVLMGASVLIAGRNIVTASRQRIVAVAHRRAARRAKGALRKADGGGDDGNGALFDAGADGADGDGGRAARFLVSDDLFDSWGSDDDDEALFTDGASASPNYEPSSRFEGITGGGIANVARAAETVSLGGLGDEAVGVFGGSSAPFDASDVLPSLSASGGEEDSRVAAAAARIDLSEVFGESDTEPSTTPTTPLRQNSRTAGHYASEIKKAHAVGSPPLLPQEEGGGDSSPGNGGITRFSPRKGVRTAPPQWQTALLDEIDALLPPSRPTATAVNGPASVPTYNAGGGSSPQQVVGAAALPDPAMAALMRRIAEL